ncbi:BatA domain-containing protein [Pedobacter duraquae]|uniref:Putative membrane protein (TIGR02226 family) n=1 Tax=Pedobacter duraquae TaxID=425511 RepID=A0A4R6ILK7_9SPHI|nr:BatA domain-containing protein [Pedobacter duraquae]TDO22983.1 putative membrane protein (TIGR02226 family) [Pedobacter duraquae]
MNFLYPGFLFALLAVAIPVIIHLFNFRKYKQVYFSNVQFLTEAKAESASGEKLKNLLILISRILAIIFLVLAFARPYFKNDATVDPGNATVVSVYVDNSFSMQSVNKEGNLLDDAKRRAREIVKGYPVSTKFVLTTNDFEGRHQRMLQKEDFLSQLEAVKISAGNKSLEQVLSRQQSFVPGNNNHIEYILSDFQQNFVGNKVLSSKAGVQVNLVKLTANALPNIAVDSVWFLSPLHRPGDQEKLVVRLRNYTNAPVQGIPVKLTIDNQQKAIANLKIPEGTIQDTLSFSGLNEGWHKAKVSIKDYPVTFDDELNFTFKSDRELKVLSIGTGNGAPYIRSLFAADPFFSLTEMAEANIKYSSFGDYRLIVLNGLENPSSGLAQQLKSYVEGGGAVVIFPNVTAGQAIYITFLQALGLPGIVQLRSEQTTISSIDFKNPLFKDVFEEIPKNLELPQVSNYFQYASSNQRNSRKLMELPLNRVFFGQYNFGGGQIFLSASSLDPKDNNLPQHPVFVPLMYKIAFSSAQAQPLFYTVGKDELVETSKTTLAANQTLRLTSEGIDLIPELRQVPGKTLVYTADQIRQPGFFELRKADSLLSVFAFNQSRLESESRYAGSAELKKILPQKQVRFLDANQDALSFGDTAKNNSNELWKLCLILSIVFLAVEILLIKFFHHIKF